MLNNEQRTKLQELIDAKWEGRLSEAEATRLREWTCEDDDACRYYLDYMMLHGLLVLEHAEDDPTDALMTLTADISCEDHELLSNLGKTNHPVLGFLGDGLKTGLDFLGQPFVLTLVMSLLLPSVLLVFLLIHIKSQPVPELPIAKRQPAHVATDEAARVARVNDCVWEESDKNLTTGTPLQPGRQIQLRKGLAEIIFADGTTVLLEGPVTFKVTQGDRGFLRTGRLVAKVPKGSEGFGIATPSATVIDLGTEFALSVVPSGTTEAYVFKGKVNLSVESATEDDKKIHRDLTAGQAVRVVRAKGNTVTPRIEPIAMTTTHFMRHVPGTLPEPTIIFAHQGNNDPETEGWQSHGGRPDKDGKLTVEAGPIEDNGTAAWFLRTVADNKVNKAQYYNTRYYAMSPPNKLTPELINEAKEKGWMYRGRIWVNPQAPPPEDPRECLCLLSYHRDDDLTWGLQVLLDKKGNQLIKLLGDSSLGTDVVIPVPHSRNRFVDYEVRKASEKKGADVFIEGRLVATDFHNKAIEARPTIRFGMKHVSSDIRCARFEWGIFRDTPETNKPSTNRNKAGLSNN